MAKFFLTNSSDFYNKTKIQIQKTDFELSFDYVEANLHALAVHKLGMQNKNAVQDGDDFVMATGTCIYKESLDYSGLLMDYDGNVPKMRAKTLGQYAVAIWKDTKLVVYGDACGCYDIYYYYNQSDGVWLISNSLYEMAKVIGPDQLTLDEFSVVERMANRYLPNAKTFFDEIKYLRGDEYIEVGLSISSWTINKIDVDFYVENDSFDVVVNKAAAELRNNARIVAKVLGTPTICVTGGLDSRLVLASFLACGVKPKLFYGVGDNRITSPRKEDEICVNQLSYEFGLPVVKGDFSVSAPLDANWDNYIKNAGFNTAYMWGGQRNVINSLRSQSDLLLFGWGGELFRNISGWTEHNETTTIALKDLLSNWYLTRAQSAPLIREALPDYDTRIEEEMRLECKYLGLNPDEMSIEDSFLIEMCYRSMADTQIPSFMQLYKYAYLLLFESNALMHRVRCGEKDEARFMLSVCYELYPKIVTIPIFTHQQWKSLDVVTMSLEPLKSTQEKWSDSFVARIIRKCFPEFLKRYIIRPLKRRVIRNYEVKNLAPNCVITSFDKLRDEKYEINMSDVRSSEDTVMWALLLRTLKSLGY